LVDKFEGVDFVHGTHSSRLYGSMDYVVQSAW
jgi:hypothetical protein